MLYALKIASRYLTAAKAQTALLVLGVALYDRSVADSRNMAVALQQYALRTVTTAELSADTVRDKLLMRGGLAGIEGDRAMHQVLKDLSARLPDGSGIINVGALAAQKAGAGMGAYAASKAGVVGLTRCLAQEWGPRIRVNSLCPGAVDTPMVRQEYGADAASRVGSRYALERIAQAHEIALAALYLSSTESAFVTGIAMAVDGGRTFH